MDYKIYLFDYEAFKAEIADMFYRALDEDELDELSDFIEGNLERLKNPDDVMPLDDLWKKKLKPRTVHDFGSIAITAYYAPEQSTALTDWMSLDDILREIQDDLGGLILGYPFGPPNNVFAHGNGDYFQSTVQAKRTLATLEMLLEQQQDNIAQHEGASEGFEQVVAVLAKAIEVGKGVYVRL